MKFAVIPPGEFMMGSAGRLSRDGGADETLHKVTLTQPFQMGMHEVTQEQYQKVMGTNPSEFKGPQNPVEMVSWNDAVEFCRKLSALPAEKSSGYVYHLPTEAGWAYACRSGTKSAYISGDANSGLGDYAWYDKNSGGTTHPVGQKKSNAWGLYDMSGNVSEFCQDWHGDYPTGSVTNPTGPSSGSLRMSRGGNWHQNPGLARSAIRMKGPSGQTDNRLGIRVVRCDATPPELQVTWNPDNTWKPGASVARLATVRNGITTPLQSRVTDTKVDLGANYFCVSTHAVLGRPVKFIRLSLPTLTRTQLSTKWERPGWLTSKSKSPHRIMSELKITDYELSASDSEETAAAVTIRQQGCG